MESQTRKTKKTRSKLGRGLSALVDQSGSSVIQVVAPIVPEQNANIKSNHDLEAVSGVSEGVLLVDVTRIVPNPHQPRRVFEDQSLEELARSITEHGLMQPIVVRKADQERYEIIAGERRWRATCQTGQTSIRAIVLEVDDAQSAELALIENIQREDLNPIERAHGFAVLAKGFAFTQGQIAERVGINRSTVANILRLIELEDEIQSMIIAGELGGGHGKALLSCKDSEQRLMLARQAVQEGWTVRMLEKIAVSDAASEIDQIDPNTPAKNELTDDTLSRMKSVLIDLEKRLGEELSTKVKLKTDQSGTKGSITIEFYDLDHFDGLMNRLGVCDIEGQSVG